MGAAGSRSTVERIRFQGVKRLNARDLRLVFCMLTSTVNMDHGLKERLRITRNQLK